MGTGLLAALALSACVEASAGPPPVAIIIDDLGYRLRNDREATEIAGLETFAVLPFTPYGRALGERLYAAGKEVMLHLPMEAHNRNELLGPGALTEAMSEGEFNTAARAAIESIPHLSGVNNHMGSLLTGNRERMRWLMAVLADYPWLVFVDSRTTGTSAARDAARAAAVPFLARDVFLDHERDPRQIHARLDELIRHAQTRGDALGIAHPHAETLAVLRARLPGLTEVRVVRVDELRELRDCRARLAVLAGSAAAAAQGQRDAEQADTATRPDRRR